MDLVNYWGIEFYSAETSVDFSLGGWIEKRDGDLSCLLEDVNSLPVEALRIASRLFDERHKTFMRKPRIGQSLIDATENFSPLGRALGISVKKEIPDGLLFGTPVEAFKLTKEEFLNFHSVIKSEKKKIQKRFIQHQKSLRKTSELAFKDDLEALDTHTKLISRVAKEVKNLQPTEDYFRDPIRSVRVERLEIPFLRRKATFMEVLSLLEREEYIRMKPDVSRHYPVLLRAMMEKEGWKDLMWSEEIWIPEENFSERWIEASRYAVNPLMIWSNMMKNHGQLYSLKDFEGETPKICNRIMNTFVQDSYFESCLEMMKTLPGYNDTVKQGIFMTALIQGKFFSDPELHFLPHILEIIEFEEKYKKAQEEETLKGGLNTGRTYCRDHSLAMLTGKFAYVHDDALDCELCIMLRQLKAFLLNKNFINSSYMTNTSDQIRKSGKPEAIANWLAQTEFASHFRFSELVRACQEDDIWDPGGLFDNPDEEGLGNFLDF
jgi:hypothetical protein